MLAALFANGVSANRQSSGILGCLVCPESSAISAMLKKSGRCGSYALAPWVLNQAEADPRFSQFAGASQRKPPRALLAGRGDP
jgi:hypothetical protein